MVGEGGKDSGTNLGEGEYDVLGLGDNIILINGDLNMIIEQGDFLLLHIFPACIALEKFNVRIIYKSHYRMTNVRQS
jgi:hypothetical protein